MASRPSASSAPNASPSATTRPSFTPTSQRLAPAGTAVVAGIGQVLDLGHGIRGGRRGALRGHGHRRVAARVTGVAAEEPVTEAQQQGRHQEHRRHATFRLHGQTPSSLHAFTDAFTAHVVEMIKMFAGKHEPFFIYVPYTAPHYPIHAKPKDIAKYRYAMPPFPFVPLMPLIIGPAIAMPIPRPSPAPAIPPAGFSAAIGIEVPT